MTLGKARLTLSGKLEFGNLKQIQALKFIAEAERIVEKITEDEGLLACSKCHECNGTGKHDCDCGNEHICGECDGSRFSYGPGDELIELAGSQDLAVAALELVQERKPIRN